MEGVARKRGFTINKNFLKEGEGRTLYKYNTGSFTITSIFILFPACTVHFRISCWC